jgi:predicted GNAT family N-acyltransferase
MGDGAPEAEPVYHLFLEAEQVPVAASALRLMDADEAHAPQIHRLVREVLAALSGPPDERGLLTVELAPQQMKITHSAVRLLLNDSQRGQAAEREILHAILQKLPDEHTMRAIEIA